MKLSQKLLMDVPYNQTPSQLPIKNDKTSSQTISLIVESSRYINKQGLTYLKSRLVLFNMNIKVTRETVMGKLQGKMSDIEQEGERCQEKVKFGD